MTKDDAYWSGAVRGARSIQEERKRREAERYHDDSHRVLLDRLEELGIDPEELKTWLKGPRP